MFLSSLPKKLLSPYLANLRLTHLALGSILTHFRFIGLSKFWRVVILIQNFNVNLHNGFFPYRVTCRRDNLSPQWAQLMLAAGAGRCLDG